MTPVLRRRIFVITVITAAVALTVYGFLPGPVEVELAKAARGTLQVTIEEEGRTRLKQRFTVSAPTAGYMRRVDLKVGDTVKKARIWLCWSPCARSRLIPAATRRRN